MEGSGITKAYGDAILIHHFLQAQVPVSIKFLQTHSKVFMKTNSERERERIIESCGSFFALWSKFRKSCLNLPLVSKEFKTAFDSKHLIKFQ